VYTHDYRWIDKAALRRTHDFYEKHGRITFLVSPYVGVVRTFAPFVGGIAQMTFSHFVPAAAAGAVLWVVTLVGVGDFFGNVPLVRDNMSAIALLGVAVGVGALAATAAWRYLRTRRRK
jgi:membrane-associated protein